MTDNIPECPTCKAEGVVMPARCLSRPESAGGLAVGCAACGSGVPATREQVAAVNRRERIWQEAQDRQEVDTRRGVLVPLHEYVDAMYAEEDRRSSAPAAKQLPLFEVP